MGPASDPQPSLPRMSSSRSLTPNLTGATAKHVLELAENLNVRFMRLQFTDILGVNKNVEIPSSQFEKALAGDIMFDGSSIEGFVRDRGDRTCCSRPTSSTFVVFPWSGRREPGLSR